MISFQDSYVKFQNISGSNNSTTLTQAKQDINIGYKRFDAALGRYFTRKQQFANLVAGQKYYQIPIDAIRVMEISVVISASYEYPLTQVRSEHEWRELNIISNYQSNIPTHYFVYGNDQVGLYPIPAQNVTSGLRYVYQPTDVDLSQDDYTTGSATVSNGSVSVTGTSTVWTSSMAGRMFQITDGSEGHWYEVASVANSTSLTLKTPYAGQSVSSVSYRIAQVFIFPGEYDDVPVDYALARFFEARNNPPRAKYHKDKYDQAVKEALERYSSSSTSHVITDSDTPLYPVNMWVWPPQAGS